MDYQESPNEELLAGLFRSVQTGDQQAFAQVYQLTAPHLLATAMRILKQRDLAEECIQEAFIRIWYRAADFTADRGRLKAWLASIVRYQAIDMLRRAARRPRSDPDSDPAAVAEDAPDMVERLAFHGVAGILRRCLELLPGNHKKAILIAFYEGATHSEVAGSINAPVGTVKSWIRRGLRQLRECIGDATI